MEETTTIDPEVSERARAKADKRWEEHRKILVDGKKPCRTCNRLLSLDKFFNDKSGLGGKKGQCKECMRAGRYPEGHIRAIDVARQNYTEERKRCRVCRVWKPHSEFYRMKGGLGGIQGRCKVCEAKNQARRLAEMPIEQYDEQTKKAGQKRAERKRRASLERTESCRYILAQWRLRGMRNKDILEVSGVGGREVRRIEGGAEFVQVRTYEKLRNAHDRLRARGDKHHG